MAFVVGCRPDSRFERLTPAEQGVDFVNALHYDAALNPYTYTGFFNGGGVGLGDLDNDGLVDIMFTGQRVSNAVYRNLGDWQFEDITERSGLGAPGVWCTGVALADVDGDGWLDVYLLKSGPEMQPNRRNELRLNNRDGTFRDVASAVGLDDVGYGTHASFVDYDRDGDLDVYVLNNSIRGVGGFDMRPGARERRDPNGANRLLRNELVETGQLSFVDVSEEAGIYGSSIGFGLGVATGFVNDDLWPDLYVSNDFFERDYLYINDGVGGFAERLTDLVPETSMGAMGADIADLTGDGQPEIFVTEMLPWTEPRYKTKTAFASWEKSEVALRNGYHRQFGRNTLLLNQDGRMLDVGRQLGVDATDWSWGALLADLDNDGWRDLYVANGVVKDLMDQDYLKFVAPGQRFNAVASGGDRSLRLLDSMPSERLPDRAFRNLGGGEAFEEVAEGWGLGHVSFSNGSAYADLDNDGDLDLVVNTINQNPLLYRNRTIDRSPDAGGFVIDLLDTLSRANRYAWGSRVTAYTRDRSVIADVFPQRGFMSTVDARPHIGLRLADVERIEVEWASGGVESFTEFDTESSVVKLVRTAVGQPAPAHGDAATAEPWSVLAAGNLVEETGELDSYPLLDEPIARPAGLLTQVELADSTTAVLASTGSTERLASLLVSGREAQTLKTEVSGLPDGARIVGGVSLPRSQDGLGSLLVQTQRQLTPRSFALHLADVTLDAQGQGLSVEVHPHPLAVTDAQLALVRKGDSPALESHGETWCFESLAADRLGEKQRVYVLELSTSADGAGARLVELNTGPQFVNVVDALFADLTGDGRDELVTASYFGAITVYARKGLTEGWTAVASGPNGLWKSLNVVDDPQHPGRRLIVGGNHGLNSRLRASREHPLELHLTDLDANGKLDQVLVGRRGGHRTVLNEYSALAAVSPGFRGRFPRFSSYARANVEDVLSLGKTDTVLRASELRTVLLRLTDAGTLEVVELPASVQRSSVRVAQGLTLGDASQALFLAGNSSNVRPSAGTQLASTGMVLRATETGWEEAEGVVSPLDGQVNDVEVVRDLLVAVRSGDSTAYTRVR